MKAVIYQNYGSPDVLQYLELEKPAPGDNEVLIRVRAAGVNPLDGHMMKGRPHIMRVFFGLRRPKITRPGIDVAGEIEAVGRNVTQFQPGDKVFGTCRGAFGEYVCALEPDLVLKPDNVSFEQAAATPIAAFTALQGLRDKGKLKPGQKVLVNGASGGVGTFTVQMAKAFGAEVTGVCSARNAEMVRSLGATRIIDYTREDFTRSDVRYDLIFDLVGNHSLLAYRRALNPTGRCILAGVLGARGGPLGILLGAIKAPLVSLFVSQKFMIIMAKGNQRDLSLISELLAAGKVTPVIDRCYSLSEAAEAMRHLEEKRARGKIVIRVGTGQASGATLP